MTDDEKWARLKADAKEIAKDSRRYVALPALVLEGTVAAFVESLAKLTERAREAGRPCMSSTIYTTTRGRHVRVTVEELPEDDGVIYSESWTGVIEKVTRGSEGARFAVAPKRSELDRLEAETGQRPVAQRLDFPTDPDRAYDAEGRSTLLSKRARVTVKVEREPEQKAAPALGADGIGWTPGRLR